MTELQSTVPARLPWGVAALLLATGDALAARFGAVAVRGELSGLTRAASGHWYFTLKDSDGAAALLRCAMFRRASVLVDFTPADGQQVEVRGRLCVYEPRGELQMVVESLQRLGTGTLYEEFLRRRARLQEQGLFDAARKRALPAFPSAIGVVTSLAAAALRDVLTTLARRAPHLRIVVYPSTVQGADAPAALVAALQSAATRREVDLLLLVRGGGSLEDLWAFNDERVVRAVAGCTLPVICGVGHETDVTLADLAADLRAPTPTAAAELAAPARDDALAALQSRQAQLQRLAARALQTQAQRLDLAVLRIGHPAQLLRSQGQRLQDLSLRLGLSLRHSCALQAQAPQRLAQRLMRAATTQLARRDMALAGAADRLNANDPHRVLRRGYAWVEAADGRPVISASALRPGQRVSAVWADGRASADVVAVEPSSDAT